MCLILILNYQQMRSRQELLSSNSERNLFTCISRRIREYGYANAMSPMACETRQIFCTGVLIGTPVMLPLIVPLAEEQKQVK
jgi:hypothetical protein